MMTEPKKFKGIEYIEIHELPQGQQEHLMQTISRDLFIKIMIDGKIISDCLQYKDYSYWFNSVYNPKPAASPQPIESPVVKVTAKLAFK